ncbi:MAG: hypothetical protein WC010_01845 [Candidatus Absconditabacterales bacterium]
MEISDRSGEGSKEDKKNDIEKTSALAIMQTFGIAEKKFYQEIWEAICQNSDAKRLLEMPELENISIDKIQGDKTFFQINISTDFKGNDLFTTIASHGFPEYLEYLNQNKTVERDGNDCTIIKIYLSDILIHIYVSKRKKD